MWYFILIIFAFIVFLFTLLPKGGSSNFEIQNQALSNIENYVVDTSNIFTTLDIEMKLKELDLLKINKDEVRGAMCYAIILPKIPDTAIYVCPICGEKTIYAKKDTENDDNFLDRCELSQDLSEFRQIVKEIKGVDIHLDESEYCKRCSPDVENPELILDIKISDAKEATHTKKITRSDLYLIKRFLDGTLLLPYYREMFFESSISESKESAITRLEKLLGVKLEN